MLPAWLARRSAKRLPAGGARRRGKARTFRPRLERLEDLTLLSLTNNWTGAGHDGLWKDAANWTLGLPAAGQDVVITSAGNTASVTLDSSSGNVTVDSVMTSLNFNLTAGAVLLTSGGGSVPTGGLTLQGGVTFAVQGGASLVIGPGSQSIAGSGTVAFDGTTGNHLYENGNCTLTIGAGITVKAQVVDVGLNFNVNGFTTLVNNGVIDADGRGFVTLEPVQNQAVANTTNTNGILEATNGNTLFLATGVVGGLITTDAGNGSAVDDGSTIL